MSIFNTGILQDIRNINSTKRFDILVDRTTTGFSSAFKTDGKYSIMTLSVRGTWVGEILALRRFISSDSNELIDTIYDQSGDVTDRITENGTYYIHISNHESFYLDVSTLTSGSVTVYGRATNNLSLDVEQLISPFPYIDYEVFNGETTTGFSSAFIFKRQYKSGFIDIGGTFTGELSIIGRRHGDSTNITIYPKDRKGRTVKNITEGGTYFFNPSGLERVYLNIVSISSGSVDADLRLSTEQEPYKTDQPVKPIVINREFPPGYSAGDTGESVVEFTPAVNSVTVVNKSHDTPIQFLLNGKWSSTDMSNFDDLIVVQPKGATTIYSDFIDSLLIASFFNYAEVEIIAGHDLPNKQLPGENEFDIGYTASRSNLQGNAPHGYDIAHIRGSKFALKSGNVLYISDDYGETISSSNDFGFPVNRAFITEKGNIIAHVGSDTSNGDIWHSTNNGATYANVLSGVITWFNNYAIDSRKIGGNDYVIFAEYGGDADATKNIWRSSDDGATWASALAVSTPADIRHFHTVHWVEAIGQWIATSGDGATQSKWYRSTDASGATWELVPITVDVNGDGVSQVFRLLGMGFDNSGIIWATDAASTRSGQADGIFRMDYSKLDNTTFNEDTDVEKLVHLDSYAYPIAQWDDDIIVGTRVKSSASGRHTPCLYLSRNRGKTWRKIMQFDTTKGETDVSSGPYGILGKDGRGRVFISFIGTSVGAFSSWQNWRGIHIKL